jgi:hypothetical protein
LLTGLRTSGKDTLRLSEKRLKRKIFGITRQDVKEGRRTMKKEELHKL